MTAHVKKLSWMKGSRPWYDHLLYWLVYASWRIHVYIGNGIEIEVLGISWISLYWTWPNEDEWNVYLQLFAIHTAYDFTVHPTFLYYRRSHDKWEAHDHYPTLDEVMLEVCGHTILYKDDRVAVDGHHFAGTKGEFVTQVNNKYKSGFERKSYTLEIQKLRAFKAHYESNYN